MCSGAERLLHLDIRFRICARSSERRALQLHV
jgi:hypothetical protein